MKPVQVRPPRMSPRAPRPAPAVAARSAAQSAKDAASDYRRNSAPEEAGRSPWRYLRWPLLAVAAAAVAIGWTLQPQPVATEADTPNWRHVTQANQNQNGLYWISASGAAAASQSIVVSDEDVDLELTTAIREAVLEGDAKRAEALLAAAQGPVATRLTAETSEDGAIVSLANRTADLQPQPLEPPQPLLTPGMRQEITDGDLRFYHIHLFDSCQDDGDVVEILLNGRPAFVVPLTNAGATLTVPISSGGTTVIAVRGIYDGGGGITVACRTSQGEGFVRVMQPQEIQPLGIVQ